MARLFDDAATQYLANDNTVVSGPPFSMACWFYSDDASVGQILVCLDNRTSAAYNAHFIALEGQTAGDPIVANSGVDSAFSKASSTSGFSVGTWHHALGVWAAVDDRAIYLDGGSKGTTAVSRNPTVNTTEIGRLRALAASTAYISGRIAEAAIWNVALNDAEALVLAKGVSPLLVRPQSLVLYLPLVRDADKDIVGGLSFTAGNSPTIGAHPRVFYPGTVLVGVPAIGGGINYDVALTLARIATASPSASAAALAGATLARQAAVSGGGAAVALANTTLARQAALTDGATAAAAAAMSLAREGDLTDAAVAAALGSSTLTRQADIAQGGQATASAATTLARESAIAEGVVAAASADLSVSIVKAAVLAATAAALADVELTHARSISESATAAAAATFTAAVYHALGISVGLAANLTLARLAASTMAATAAANANAILAEVLDLSLGATATASGTMNLSRVMEAAASALAAATATLSVARSLGMAQEGVAAEAAAAIALTLMSRDLDLTLDERSLALSLVSRALGLTLPDRP